MFSYQPNQSRAGEFIGQGITNQAQLMAQADLDRATRQHNAIIQGAGLVGDIAKTAVGFAMGGPAGAAMAGGMGGGEGGGNSGGGLLQSFIGAYAQKEQDKSDAKIYGNLLKIVGPAFGKDGDMLLEQYNSLESDRDKAQFGGTLLGSLGQISNMYMANRNAGIRENQQSLTAAMPRVREAAAAQGRVAAGQGTMGVPANVNLDYVR